MAGEEDDAGIQCVIQTCIRGETHDCRDSPQANVKLPKRQSVDKKMGDISKQMQESEKN